MKPLNKRTPVPANIAKHLQQTSEEKRIPEDQWKSLKKAAAKEPK
jgi:hypothetical protein